MWRKTGTKLGKTEREYGFEPGPVLYEFRQYFKDVETLRFIPKTAEGFLNILLNLQSIA